MIIVMNIEATEEDIIAVEKRIKEVGFDTHLIRGVERNVIGAIGDRQIIYSLGLEIMPGVEKVVPIMKPYKLVSKEVKQETSVIQVKNVTIGGTEIVVIAGPCAVESREQLEASAQAALKGGAKILRGGAFKPRTSPYAFQGLEEDGLKMLAQVAEDTGLLVVTEVIDEQSVDLAVEYVDILQIGARNMQNFQLLRRVGKTNKPVVLKRGLAATVEEWLMAAEYIMSGGNYNVILCERGIRTFETATRNTLDISAVPVVKGLSHLPIIIDPSHATGDYKLVKPLAKAAVAVGADGLLIEVHPEPTKALCDGPQSLTPQAFQEMMQDLKPIAVAVGRNIGG
ncbi:MAG: 3-deoxy-7-phosphoheptulonate synthase [Thermincolia bacterium]